MLRFHTLIPTLLLLAALPLQAAVELRREPLGHTLRDELRALETGRHLQIPGFLLPQDLRETMRVERVEILAPGASIWSVDGDARTRLDPPDRMYYRGRVDGRRDIALAFSTDREGADWEGYLSTPDGQYTISLEQGKAGASLRIEPLVQRDSKGTALDFTCGQQSLGTPTAKPVDPLLEYPSLRSEFGVGPDFEAVIAVDTDMELLDLKFARNTTNALAYISSLINQMSALYEAQVNLRLRQGVTLIRNPPGAGQYTGDPYTVAGSPANGDHLDEFSNYWRLNYPEIPRTLSMLLSGKSGSANSSSGIAWLDAYCETGFQFGNPPSTFGGFSYTQVFRFAGSNASHDVSVVAHELGHNFGSPHTHCYNRPEFGGVALDQCFSGECYSDNPNTPGCDEPCYSGATSCPAGGSGTLMSYCHFGACAQANQLSFHTTTRNLFGQRIAANTPVCFRPVNDYLWYDGFWRFRMD